MKQILNSVSCFNFSKSFWNNRCKISYNSIMNQLQLVAMVVAIAIGVMFYAMDFKSIASDLVAKYISTQFSAFLVAKMRAMETEKGDKALIQDPYAKYLQGTVLSFSNVLMKTSHYESMMDFIAVRTKVIDDEMVKVIQGKDNFEQIVLLGAGLDTRAWRLSPLIPKERTINYFELDFPDAFEYKLPILKQKGVTSSFIYHPLIVNLGNSSWPELLMKEGFSTNKKTFWLLEGLTAYFTEDECDALFQNITMLSTKNSRLMSTFVTPSWKSLKWQIHKFKPTNALEFVKKHGWVGTVEDITNIGLRYNRDLMGKQQGYVMVVANLNKK